MTEKRDEKRDEKADAEMQPIHTARGDVVRITSTMGRVLITIADHHDAASIALEPAEAERIAKALRVEAYVAEHG